MFEKVVSIITPSFNSKKTIENTFKSVVSQTFTDWEWIIVDDCSTDNSFEFIKKLIRTDKRIFLYKLDKNRGTAAARNYALKMAKGRYVTFLDSDDSLNDNYLEEQVSFIKKFGPIITAGYRIKTAKNSVDYYPPDLIDYKRELKNNPLSCLTTMFDRQIVKDVMFPEDLFKPEDYVFWLDILKKGFVARSNHKILATYYIHENSKSYKKTKLIKNMYCVYHKYQHKNFLLSWLYVIRWAFYSFVKYRKVKR